MHVTKVFGAPGTGKTTSILKTLEGELQQGVPLNRIAFITHSVAAIEEARKRAKFLFPKAKADDFRYFKTIHAICFAEMSMARSAVMQPEDYLEFGDYAGVNFSTDFSRAYDEDGLPMGWGRSPGNMYLGVRQFASAWRLPIEHPELRDSLPPDARPRDVAMVLKQYSDWKLEAGKRDFVDMLEGYCEKGRPLDAEVVIVDEAQDLSRLQWECVHRMWANAARGYIAGDDDQSIYGFIGADPMGFLRHPADRDIVLPRTYRLHGEIYAFASEIIGRVKERKSKAIETKGPGGRIEFWNRDVEMLPINPKERTMIIARHNKQLVEFGNDLRQRGTPFAHNGRYVTGSGLAFVVYNYLRAGKGHPINANMAAQICDTVGLFEQKRKIQDAARGAADRTYERAELEALGVRFDAPWQLYLNPKRAEGKRAQLDALWLIQRDHGPDILIKKPTIELTTYHASKGREAEHIVLLTDVYNAAWEGQERDPDSERRLAYVGVTRAEKRVTIVGPQSDKYMRSLV